MTQDEQTWRGYDFDELRIQKYVTLTKIELEKAKVHHKAKSIHKNAKQVANRPILRKLAGALDYFDYAVIAFNVGTRMFKLFHRKK